MYRIRFSTYILESGLVGDRGFIVGLVYGGPRRPCAALGTWRLALLDSRRELFTLSSHFLSSSAT